MEADDGLFYAWYVTRPKSVKELIDKYPPGKYRIKQGAPYGIACPGTIVEIDAWNEGGAGGIVSVAPEDRLPEALLHLHQLCWAHGGSYREACLRTHGVRIEFKWLEPL